MPTAQTTADDPYLPGVLEASLGAEAGFVRRLLEAAPPPEGSAKDARHFELEARYERYMPSAEVTAIARLFYMLEAYGVTDADALRRLLEAHNGHMAALADDVAYLRRMRVPKARLLEARFKDGAVAHVAANFASHPRAALDATAVGRLLVEFANRHQVAEAMDLLAALGFFRAAPGTHHARLFVSAGRLEALYRGYLAELARGVAAVLASPGGASSGGPGGTEGTEGAEGDA